MGDPDGSERGLKLSASSTLTFDWAISMLKVIGVENLVETDSKDED